MARGRRGPRGRLLQVVARAHERLGGPGEAVERVPGRRGVSLSMGQAGAFGLDGGAPVEGGVEDESLWQDEPACG